MKPINISFTGDPQVIKNLFRKKKLLAKNDPAHKKIKTTLILPGGGQRGVFEAGATVTLEKLNLVDAFDYIIGASTGAPVGYYALCKETALGSTVYFEENVKNHFINFLRLWKVIDIETVERVFRGEKDKNLSVFRNSRPKLLISVTDSKTGEGKFLDVKSFSDPLSCIIASICVPILDGGKSVLLNGRLYVDGGLSNPLPIEYAIKTLGATDILIVLPYTLAPMKQYPMLVRLFLRQPLFHLATNGLRAQILTFVDRYNKELNYLKQEKQLPRDVRIGIIHPSKIPINEFTMDKQSLEKVTLRAMEFTEKLFQNGQQEVKSV